MSALTPRVPDTAANCPDITVRFLGLGGLSAGERQEERGWQGGHWDVPSVSPHMWEGRWGGCLQREGAGLKREASWLADSGYLSRKKGWSRYPRGLANVWPNL